MDKKTVLAIFLSLALVMGYNLFYAKKNAQKPDSNNQKVSESELAAKNGEEQKEVAAKSLSYSYGSIIKKGDDRLPGKDIRITGPLYTAILNSKGGNLASFKLNNYKNTLGNDTELVEMVSMRDGMEYPLSVTFPDSTVNVLSDVIYETSTDHLNLEKISSTQTVKFSKLYPKEVKIEKIYTFYPEKYTIDLEVRVHNLSDDALKENALLAWNQYIDPSVKMDRYGHTGPIFMYGKEELEKTAVKKITKTETFGPDISWGGFESKYFIASMIPEQPSLTKFVMSKDGNNLVSTCLEGPKNTILPGQLGSFRYTVYIGPKDYDILKAEKIGLENSIDLGSWIKWLSLPLLKCLKFIYGYVHNYGIAIIILTVLIKLIFWPLGNMSYRSMKNMQKLSPQIKQLQEKYKDDKAKLNQEVMGLYKRYKVNPMGGCLPIAIQLPVFFGLYRTLLYSIELRHAPFFFWIQDLSAKDPYYITPIIMGATMFLQQKMSPQPAGNEMQAKLMLWMPVIFTFMFLNFPSGLVVYWLFNNILSIGQQYYINKQTS